MGKGPGREPLMESGVISRILPWAATDPLVLFEYVTEGLRGLLDPVRWVKPDTLELHIEWSRFWNSYEMRAHIVGLPGEGPGDDQK